MKKHVYGKEDQRLIINKQLNRGCYATRKFEYEFKVWLSFVFWVFLVSQFRRGWGKLAKLQLNTRLLFSSSSFAGNLINLLHLGY